ncbi:MAG TPA: hypothetical protein VKV25_08450 [Acidimicrobiales bacterium]|nr:hypothetical protein [Acidimicrobiales bacterium]
MLYAFGFEKVAVVVGDLYFVDPHPGPGQEGPERGVRLEARMLVREELRGSVYSATPILVERPIWRADLLESVAGEPGSHDRTHHHPRFVGWEPGRRQYEPAMSEDPLGYVAAQLADLPAVLERARIDADAVPAEDIEGVRAAVPEIIDVTKRLLARVRAGELARPPAGDGTAAGARVGWL